MSPYQWELFDTLLYCIVVIHCIVFICHTLIHIAYNFFFPVLDALAFERLLGPCMGILKRNEAELKEMMSRTFGSKVKIINSRKDKLCLVNSNKTNTFILFTCFCFDS